jgi:hypothetical protein
VWLTADLVTGLTMSGAVPLLPVCAFTSGTWTALPLPLMTSRSGMCNLFLVTKLVRQATGSVVFVISYVV